MNSAIQPKFSTATAAPSAETQNLFKEPTSRTFQNTYHHLYYQCLAGSFVISRGFDLPPSNVFSHIQALFCKMGGWVPTSFQLFAGCVAAEYYFSRIAHRQMGFEHGAARKGER
jgi:hypothetical protein